VKTQKREDSGNNYHRNLKMQLKKEKF